jgi:predicted permease
MVKIWVVIVCVVLGVVCARQGWFAREGSGVLNSWVIYIALPCLIISKLGVGTLGLAAVMPAIGAWVQLVTVAVIIGVAARWTGWNARVQAGLTLAAGLGNTAFVGVPLTRVLLGEAAGGVAIVVDQLGTFLAFSTLGLWIADRGAGRMTEGGATLSRVSRFPTTWAVAVALLLPVPAVVRDVCAALGDTLTPIALFAVGLQLRPTAGGRPGALAFGLALKLFVVPLLTFGACQALGVATAVRDVVVVQSAMAPMATAVIVSADRDLAPDLTRGMLGVGIPLSLVTVPLWAWWLGAVSPV